MRKIFFVMAMMVFGFNAIADDELLKDKIYFFTHIGCPYCEMAESYITQNMPDISIETVSIDKPGGLYLFKKCAEKFELGRNVGTPLFCIGDEYLMGWSDENQKRFVELSAKFNK